MADYPQSPIPTPPPRTPWYKRNKRFTIPGAAVLVLVLVVAGYFLLRSPYQERGFDDQLKSLGAMGFEGDNAWSHVDGDTAYTVNIDTGDSYGSAGTAIVRAIPLGDGGKIGKPKWTKKISSHGADWDTDAGVDFYPGGGLAIRYASEGDKPGRYFMIDPADGSYWHSQAADDDYFDVVSVPAGVVVRQTSDGSSAIAYDISNGHTKWKSKGLGYYESLPEDFDQAGSFDSPNPSHGLHKSTRAVFIDANNNATVVDLKTGKKLANGTKQRVTPATDDMGDTSGHRLVYNGMLIDSSDESGFSIRAFSLKDMSQTWVYNAPSGAYPGWVEPCGETLICIEQHRNDDTDEVKPSTQRLVVLDLADGSEEKWDKKVPGLASAIPVGDRIVVTAHGADDATTTIYDQDGDVQRTLHGQDAARIDNATILLADGVVSSDEVDPNWSMSGYGVQSGGTSQLGKFNVDLTTCEHSDAYLACADTTNGKFRFYRFRS